MMKHAGDNAPRVVVVGGGISGLAAAYRLRTSAAVAGRSVDIKLLEAGDRVGGTIGTRRQDGFVMELGPDSMLTAKPWGRALCEEVGLGERLVGTIDGNKGTAIAIDSTLQPLPEGFEFMVPTRLWPMVTTPLFTLAGKVRAAADIVIPKRKDTSDESLASFVRRRLGSEVLEKAAQPLAGGIYTADPERLSLAATMPRFIEMEQRHRSLLVAMRREATGGRTATGPRYSLFTSLAGGLEEFPRRLAELLPEGSIHTNAEAEELSRTDGHWRVRAAGNEFEADAVCLATPAFASSSLVESVSEELSHRLAAIPYASSLTINLVFDESDIPNPLEGFGFVVPAAQKRTTLACTYSSRKYPGRAPSGSVLLRAFAGGALFPDKIALSDSELTGEVLSDLRELLGIVRSPREVIVSRYPQSMPQYQVGHLDLLGEIESSLAGLPGLYLAGAGYSGVGIPDCVNSGEKAAAAILAYLASED